MARIGGRNTALAWIAGIVCLGVVVGLGYLAAPMLPAIGQYLGDLLASWTR
ncbi:hypothetical protein J2Y69_001291 [Microbacterium resistens]|uniref:Uncharacterized protein n=1 Tax=Microbacterium resistens TaxID=156977 RepID=A0ABU1SAQ4_9MICO|nr:hypothetical protein [Microbacterium resistens]MDR6866698.1 hypothetical protein [Microbacterium resistens]